MAPPRMVWTLAFWLLSSVATPALAQDSGRPTSRQFQWKFANDGIGFSLGTCLTLGIQVQSWDPTRNDTFGIPPFYMIAMPVGGTPTTTLIGTDNRTLSWQVTHPIGSRLMLNVVDSTQSSGGIPPGMFTVIAGSTTSCVVPEPSSPDFRVTSNITHPLETCEPWGLRIHGGVPPYNITFAAVNSPVVTNVTISSGNDAYTYINRADPNGQLIAGISDFTGRWATGTPLVNTTGSTDVSCTGLISRPGVAAELDAEDAERRRADDRRRTALIAGVTVPLVVLFLGGVAFAVWFYLRKKKQQKELAALDLEPRQYKEEPLDLPPTYFTNSTATTKAALSRQNIANHNEGQASGHPGGPPSSPTDPNRPPSIAFTASSNPSSSAHDGVRNRPSFSNFPTRPVRGKAAEASQPVVLSPDSEFNESSTLLSGNHVVIRGQGSSADNGEEIIIQHRDGGVVRELPPPYADRTRADHED